MIWNKESDLLNSMVGDGTSVMRDDTSIVSDDISVISDAEVFCLMLRSS